MTLNRLAGIFALSLASLLVACDDPKTIEGTIWVAGTSGSPSKLAGVPVTLLPPKIRDALKAHLEAFDERVNAATLSIIENATTSALTSTQSEKASAQKALDGTIAEIDETKKKLDAAAAIERGEQDGFDLASAPLNERLREINATAKSLEERIAEQKSVLAIEQAKKDAAYKERNALLESQLAEAKLNLDRAKKSSDDIQAAAFKKRTELGEALYRRYLEEKIKVVARVYSICSGCSQMLCIAVQNTGDKAIVSINPRLLINGKDFTLLKEQMLQLAGEWDRLRNFSVKNEFKEDVYGLPPGAKWVDPRGLPNLNECYGARIFINTTAGDGKRAWDSVGGLNAHPKIEIGIVQGVIADPKKLSSEGAGVSRVWRYNAETPEIIFAPEINAALDPAIKTQLAERARAVELAEVTVTQIKAQLDELKPERATTQALVDAEAQYQGTREEIKKANADLAELNAPLLAAKESTQSAASKLAAREVSRTDLIGRLQQLDADMMSLKQKKGSRFDDIQVKAKASLDLSVIETKWYAELLTILKDGGGVTVQSDIDGRYRFEKITWKLPVLFAVSEQSTVPGSIKNLRGVYGTQRIPAYFWIEAVDTSKTTLVDLGKSSSVQLVKGAMPAIIDRVAAVSGLPTRSAAASLSDKKEGSEALCAAAHRVGLINPETLEIFEFGQVPKDRVESVIGAPLAALQMQFEFAKLKCATPLVGTPEYCASEALGPDKMRIFSMLLMARRLGDAATIYAFRAKASSRDGRLVTHDALCVVDASGKVTATEIGDLK